MKRQSDSPIVGDVKKKSKSATEVLDTKVVTKRHVLGDGKKSWIISYMLEKDVRPTKEEVDELWLLRPEEKGAIMIFKLTPIPRYNQTFNDEGKAYNFSGMTHTALPVPPLLRRYLDYANRVCHTVLANDYGDRAFNMVFCNWYMDGSDHIGYHSDDESQLYKNAKGETLVFSISFGQERKFLVRKKDKESNEKTLSLSLVDNCCLLMGGQTQVFYKHKVPPTKAKNVKRRCNLTFRMFK